MNPLKALARLWRTSARAWKVSLLGLLVLVSAVGVIQSSLLEATGKVRLVDDEGAYLPVAVQLAEKHRTNLGPGALPFHHRPPLATVAFARLIENAEHQDSAAALSTIRSFHVGLFLLILVATYVAAVLLDYGPSLSLIPPVLLSLSGAFWIYLHTAHSEILHGAFLALGFLALLAFARSRKHRYLFLTGLMLGLALLTRGSLKPFVWALVPFVALEAYLANDAKLVRSKRLARSALAAVALLGGLCVAVGPQLLANRNAGHGLRLSANTWRNVEFGLRRHAPGDPPGFPELKWREATRSYHAAGSTVSSREAAAKRRTLTFVRTHSLLRVAYRQLRKVVERLFAPRSLVEEPRLAERFSRRDRTTFAVLTAPWLPTWFAVLVAGVVGACARLRESAGARFIALFLLTYLAGFLLVPTSRLFVPAIPVLCLAAPAAWLLLGSRLGSFSAVSAARRRAVGRS